MGKVSCQGLASQKHGMNLFRTNQHGCPIAESF